MAMVPVRECKMPTFTVLALALLAHPEIRNGESPWAAASRTLVLPADFSMARRVIFRELPCNSDRFVKSGSPQMRGRTNTGERKQAQKMPLFRQNGCRNVLGSRAGTRFSAATSCPVRN